MRPGLLATTALVVMMFAGNTARACDCVTPEDPFKNADVVFQGELIGSRRVGATSPYVFTYTFSVDRWMKGPTVKTIDVMEGTTSCDAEFVPNTIYIVYGTYHEGRVTSGSCSGNRIVARTKLYRPYETVESTSFWERWFTSALIACGLGVLLGSGAFVWHRYSTRLP